MELELGNDETRAKLTEGQKVIGDLSVDKHATEEEFQNFMHRVVEVDKIVRKLSSSDPLEQKCGQVLADEILEKKVQTDWSELGELRIKADRTVINKYPSKENETDENKMSQEVFMKSVEKDAKERAENRRIRNERAKTLMRIGNGAFKQGNYEKAVTYYGKAIEQRKDSTELWNNSALAHMHLGLFEKALHDCEWALKANHTDMKALLNSAKCSLHLGNDCGYRDFLRLAHERNPRFSKFIDEFQESMEANFKIQDDS